MNGPSTRRVVRRIADQHYLCARIRARSARLLSGARLRALEGLAGLAELFHELLDGDYAPELKQCVLDVTGLAELEAGLAATRQRRLNGLHTLVLQSVPAYGYLVLGDADGHNLRALVRAVVHHASLEQAEAAYLPRGSISREQYREAVAAASPEALLRVIAAVYPWAAQEWETLLAQGGLETASPSDLEWRLERLHYQAIERAASRTPTQMDAHILRQHHALLIDLANLRTSLRALGRHPEPAEIERAYHPGGTLTLDEFAALMRAEVVEQLQRQLPDGPLATVVERGMLAMVSGGRPSVFERHIDRQQLRWCAGMARRHPVSVAVLLHYLARLRGEAIALRMTARILHYRLPAGKAQEGWLDE